MAASLPPSARRVPARERKKGRKEEPWGSGAAPVRTTSRPRVTGAGGCQRGGGFIRHMLILQPCRGTKARCSLSGSFLAAKGGIEKGLGQHGAALHRPLVPCCQAAGAGKGALAVCPGRDWLPCLPCPLPPYVPRPLWFCSTPCWLLSLQAAAPYPGLLLWLQANAGGCFSSACTCPHSPSSPLCFPWKCHSVPFFPLFPPF